MKTRTLAAIAGLLIGATGCTPQEVRFWRAFHAEHPAEAEQAIIDAGLEGEATKYQQQTEAPEIKVSAYCGRITLFEVRHYPNGWDSSLTGEITFPGTDIPTASGTLPLPVLLDEDANGGSVPFEASSGAFHAEGSIVTDCS